jgi:hypothetical protein
MGLKNVKNEGSIVFWLNHEHKDWPTNSSGYNFDTVQNEDISAEVTKHPDKTVEIKLTGPFDKTFVFRRSIPPCDQRGLQVAMAWKDDNVQLYLNGNPEDSKTVEEAE